MSADLVRPLNPRRITVLAVNTFTQLVRMKVFYFLAVFAAVLIAANFLDLPVHAAPESAGVEVLYSIKSSCTGTMTLFSLVMAIVATALLIPRDVEDRTLYTILAKPVPRLDYLLGKLLGVVALIFVSLLVMDLLMTAVLALRTNAVVEQQLHAAEHFGYTAEMKAALEAETRQLGPTWNLQAAVLAIFLRAVVMACVAMLLSTFSTSTLFTAVVGFLVLFVGFFQADAREFYFSGSGTLGRIGALLLSLFLPDLQSFNVIDAIIEGKLIEAGQLGMVAGVTAFYFLVYTFASWLIFAKKEI